MYPVGMSGGLRCARCRCRVTASIRRHWIADGICRPLVGGSPALASTVRFGKHVLHPSHAFAWSESPEAPQGTWECTACGGAACIRARGLLLPCTAVPTLANPKPNVALDDRMSAQGIDARARQNAVIHRSPWLQLSERIRNRLQSSTPLARR